MARGRCGRPWPPRPWVGLGAWKDPLHRLGHAWRKAVGLAARALGGLAAAMLAEVGLLLGGHRRLKAALDRDGGLPQAREPARHLVRAEGERWQTWLEQPRRLGADGPPPQDVMDPSAQRGTQATAPAPDGGPGGQRRKQPVAPDRRIAMADADRRHGRKSRAKTCNGLQAHVGRALESHVTPAGVVRPGTEPEHAAGALLVETVEKPPGRLQLDSAVGSMASPRMTQWAEQGVSILARPWPQGAPLFTKDDFTLDCAHGAVTWPGGQTVPLGLGQDVQFPASACDGCPPRAQGTTARIGPGSSRPIRADAPCPPKLRAKSTTKRGRASLRKRTAVEQALSHHIVHQGRRARSKGLRKNPFDGRRHAAVSTLQGAAHYVEELQLAS